MMLVVTGVGFLIHVYSVGYMEHEGGYYRYFAYLNIFMFFMLTLVMANNYSVDVRGLGGRGPGVVPADRILVPEEVGGAMPARKPSSPTASATSDS